MSNRLASLKELLGRRTPGPWYALGEDIAANPKVPLPAEDTDLWMDEPTTTWVTLEAASLHEPDAAAITALSNAADELVAVAQAAERYRELESNQAAPGSLRQDELKEARATLDAALSRLNDVLGGEET